MLMVHQFEGTARPKPVIRTTGQSRIQNSQISWALGFFGPSFYEIADPELTSFTNGSLFDVVVIPEGGVENNTLASYVRDLVATQYEKPADICPGLLLSRSSTRSSLHR